MRKYGSYSSDDSATLSYRYENAAGETADIELHLQYDRKEKRIKPTLEIATKSRHIPEAVDALAQTITGLPREQLSYDVIGKSGGSHYRLNLHDRLHDDCLIPVKARDLVETLIQHGLIAGIHRNSLMHSIADLEHEDRFVVQFPIEHPFTGHIRLEARPYTGIEQTAISFIGKKGQDVDAIATSFLKHSGLRAVDEDPAKHQFRSSLKWVDMAPASLLDGLYQSGLISGQQHAQATQQEAAWRKGVKPLAEAIIAHPTPEFEWKSPENKLGKERLSLTVEPLPDKNTQTVALELTSKNHKQLIQTAKAFGAFFTRFHGEATVELPAKKGKAGSERSAYIVTRHPLHDDQAGMGMIEAMGRFGFISDRTEAAAIDALASWHTPKTPSSLISTPKITGRASSAQTAQKSR